MTDDAIAVLAEIEARGGRAALRDGKLVVAPAGIVTPDLRARIRSTGRDLAAHLLANREAATCALCRIPDRPDALVRLCTEFAHWHVPTARAITYDCTEIDLLLAWARASGLTALDPAMRNLLLDLKVTFGGRIDPETADMLAAADANPTRS